MDVIFKDSENNKISNLHRLLFNHSDKAKDKGEVMNICFIKC